MTRTTPMPDPTPGHAPPGLLDCWARGAGILAFPAAWRVILLAMIGALFLVIAISALAGWAFTMLPWIGPGWSTWVGWLGGGLTLALGIVLFPAVFAAAVGLLLDQVADVVDRERYRHLPTARPVPLSEQIVGTLRFFAVLVAANLLAFVTVMIIPGINLIVWFALNGFLLGREFFDLAALRRMPAAQVKTLRRRYRGPVIGFGLMLGLSLLIPLVNLLVPVIGTAAMVHFVNRLPEVRA